MDQSRLNSILAFGFGVIFVGAILLLVVLFPNPTGTQYEIFRIVIALAAGGVGAVIPGLLNVQMKLGLTSNQSLAVQAGGALAVFIIVYFYSPTQKLVDVKSDKTISTIQGSTGDCGINIANVNGSVTTNTRC